MKINWLVRFKNPIFWVQIVSAILLPILAYFGMTLENLSSWTILGDTLLKAVSSPYVLGTVLISIWGAVNDPTTHGIGDSNRAMTYIHPKK